MRFSCKTRATSSLIKDMGKGKYRFDSPLQREEGQWNKLIKSELIDSILRDYPLDPIRAIERDNGTLEVIDGEQRMTTIRDFIEGKFALHKSLKPIVFDDGKIEHAGKKYNKLDESVRDRIDNYEIQVYIFTDCTDEDVREMFRRQNSGKPLNSAQKRTCFISSELNKVIYSLSKMPCMDKFLTAAQRRNGSDRDIILEVLMLTELLKYDFGSFRNNDINAFIAQYKIDNNKVEIVKSSLEKLDAIADKLKINKITLPFAIYGMYRVINEKRSEKAYSEWLQNFSDNYDKQADYLQYCKSGTSSSESVKGRLAYFNKAVDKM